MGKNCIEGAAEQGERADIRKALVIKAKWRKYSDCAMKEFGVPESVARRVAGNSRGWWRNADQLVKTLLTIVCFDQLGVPRLS